MGHRRHLLTNVMTHGIVDPQPVTCSTSYVCHNKARERVKSHTRTEVYLGYRENYDQGEESSGGWGTMVLAGNGYASAGEKRLAMPNTLCMSCLGRLHGGSSERVDGERQLLMCWGSTSVALSQPTSLAPPIKFCTKNISWIDGIWSPSPRTRL